MLRENMVYRMTLLTIDGARLKQCSRKEVNCEEASLGIGASSSAAS